MARHLWFIRGWPSRMVGLLGDGPLATSTMEAFNLDLGAHQAMCALPQPTKAIKNLIRRSCFNHASVRQYIKVGFFGVCGCWGGFCSEAD